MPAVSIIVPFHDEKQFLVQCLQSALQQTWRDLEVWVVDDGSSISLMGQALQRLLERSVA